MVLPSDTAASAPSPTAGCPGVPLGHPLSSRHWPPRPPELPTLGLEREGLAQQGPQARQVSSSWGLQGQGEGTLHRDGQQGLGVLHSNSLGPGEWRWRVSEAPGLCAQGLAVVGWGLRGEGWTERVGGAVAKGVRLHQLDCLGHSERWGLAWGGGGPHPWGVGASYPST